MSSLWDDPPTRRIRRRRKPERAALWAGDGWWGETRVGVFETLQVRRGHPVALEEHCHRLRASQQTVGRPLPPATIAQQLLEAARILPARWAGLRVELTSTSALPTLSMHLLPRRAGMARWRQGVTVVTARGRIAPPAALPAQVKSSERLPSILAWGEAPSRRPFEILWCNAGGCVTEGTVSNLFIVRGGQLLTPPAWAGALAGVVRGAIVRLARRARLAVAEQPFTRHELFTAAEAFLTNSLIGVVPVRMADGRRIGTACPGPVTRRLQRAYAATLRG